jgi:histidinol-phosphatase
MTSKYKNELALARQMATLADSITMPKFISQDLVISTKPDHTEVTDADKACESALRDFLGKNLPEDGIVGEEYGQSVTGKNRYWVIDPIDGTRNFMRGVPNWATLIGLVENGEVVVGVVSAPALNRTWFATKGGGAFTTFNYCGETDLDDASSVCNCDPTPKKILVSKVSKISDASIAYSDFKNWNERLNSFTELLNDAWRTRGFGDFWIHMMVAEGVVDAALEPQLALWDMAALDVIVKEAGGSFSDITGESGVFGNSGMSTNGLLLGEIVERLNK